MAAVFATGFEYGIKPVAGVGNGLSIGIFEGSGATISISSSVKRSGSYSLRIQATGSDRAYFYCPDAGSGTNALVARFYVRVDTYATAEDLFLARLEAPTGRAHFGVDSAGVSWTSVGAGAKTTGPTLSTGQFYRVDWKMDASGTTWTSDLMIDGAALPQATEGSHAADSGVKQLSFRIDDNAGTPSVTGDAYFDDVIASLTATDYPFGAGSVLLAPLEGTTAHQSITTTEWQSTSDFSSFADFTGSAETVTPPLLGPPLTTATASGFRMNKASAITGNGRWPVAKPTLASNMNAQLVSAIVAVREASAGTNNAVIRAELSGSTTNIFASANPGWGTTWNYLAAFMSVGPGSAVWTPANVDLLNIEFDSTDASPNIWCQGIVVEVAQPDNSLLWQPRAMQTIYQL